jgi:hypothetical protein
LNAPQQRCFPRPRAQAAASGEETAVDVREADDLRLYPLFMATYVGLWALFLLVRWALDRPWPDHVDAIDLLLLCLAVFRLTEIVTEEKVARFLRAPFCKVVRRKLPDGTEEEDEVPTDGGIRHVAGELLLCPWCAGVWIGTLLTFAWVLAPGFTRVVLVAFAVAAGGLIFQIFAKLMDRTRKSIHEEG